ncbi:MAG: efflux RND transporter permease subunit [Pseudomonadota bacterium]
MSDDTQRQTGLIAWFANNPVAANLLMFVIIFAGIFGYYNARKQTTPDFELNIINVSVPYPGAAPQEVEQGVLTRIEEALQDVPGIAEVNSTAREGSGTVSIELEPDASLDSVQSQVKTRVDAIATFPELAEQPVIERQEIPVPVIFISVYGDMDAYARKEIAKDIRDGVMQLPGINDVQYLGDRPYEISFEVSQETLQRYNLTMTQIAQAVRDAARDIPGGTIRTEGGDILLRTQGQVFTGQEYADIAVLTFADGTRLKLADIARINDGFVETKNFGRLNREPVVNMQVMAGGQQNELKTAALVKEYVEEFRETLPDSVTVATWVDRASYLQQRLDMMLKNLWQGLLLVFIILSLFLRLKFALWVIIGIPVTFFGAIALLPYGPWPVTINVISLFGFILVLGIVVDDAIIIGESIYTKTRADGHTINNVVAGANKVALTATFGVLTTIAAFAPMLFVGGVAGSFLEAVSVVVALCLLFSLVESKLILPAHLAHSRIKPVDEAAIFSPYSSERNPLKWVGKFFQRIQRRTQHGLHWVINSFYEPLLKRALAARAITFSLFLAMIILSAGMFAGGLLRFVIFPELPGDYLFSSVSMQTGTPEEQRNATLLKMEAALYEIRDEYLAANPDGKDPIRYAATFTDSPTRGNVIVEMPPTEDQTLTGDELAELWREHVGELPGVRNMQFTNGNNFGGGPPLSFAFSGENIDAMEAAAAELAIRLRDYEGVFDIRNSAAAAGDEIELSVKPEGEALGITLASLGTQVRQAFFGEEVQRIQRGSDELRVMLRYPEAQRRSVDDLETMLVVTPDGDRVPFGDVAEVEFGSAYSSISRQDGVRLVTVSADIDTDIAQPGMVIGSVSATVIPEILSRHPGVEYQLEGASLEEQEFIRNLGVAALAALFLIYALIAIPLKSYSQPLLIMAVIPFGFIGAMLGHLILDMEVSMFSCFGLIALAGVVVNDSLIMVDFINKAREGGAPIERAVVESGKARFRAIILTSITTAIGLVPIMLETSAQAQFVIPMAVSLSFGIIFATMITLVFVPVLYMLQRDFFDMWGALFRKVSPSRRTAIETVQPSLSSGVGVGYSSSAPEQSRDEV